MYEFNVPEFGNWVCAEIARGADRDPGALLAAYVAFVGAEMDRLNEIRQLKRQQADIDERISDLARESHMNNMIG